MFYEQKAEYKSYLPEILENIEEIDQLDKSVKMQIEKLNAIIKEAVNNKSVQNATENGIARWEKILNISSPLNSSLQARRAAVRSKLMTKPPINLLTLKGIIEAYMGVEVEIFVENFIVKVRYRGVSRIADLNPLYETAYQTIPANLLLDIAYAFVTYAEEKARFATYSEQSPYTYEQIMKGAF